MSASEQIDAQIAAAPGWRGERLTWFRGFVAAKAPELTEGFKWRVAVFERSGKPVCAMSAFKAHVKFNFFRGAELADPDGLFNAGLDSKAHRSIDSTKETVLDETALRELLRRSVERGG